MQGPADPVLRRALSLFSTALWMLDLVHLSKSSKRNSWILPCPRLWTVPCALPEILQAVRLGAVFELYSDHGWSLADALNEIAFCRGEMPTFCSPARARHALLRPHAKDGKSGKGGGGRKRTLQDDARASESASAKAAAKVKAAGKAGSAPNAPPKGWDAS